jgi:hypothetical protein
MAKEARANLERLLRSAWDRQCQLGTVPSEGVRSGNAWTSRPVRTTMLRGTKFGYGFCFIGVGVPFLIEKLLGLSLAIFASVACLVLGVTFLISGHRHNDDARPWKLGEALAAGCALCSVIILLSMGVMRAMSPKILDSSNIQQRFTVKIDDIYFANSLSGPNGEKTGSETGFLVVIKNTDSPSSAEDYRLTIKSNTLDRERVEPFVIPDNYDSLKGWLRGQPIMFAKREDFLYSKTLHAIPTGDTQCGWLVFDFPEVSRDQLIAPSTMWELSFSDVKNVRQILQWKGADFAKWKPGIPLQPQCGAARFYIPPQNRPY